MIMQDPEGRPTTTVIQNFATEEGAARAVQALHEAGFGPDAVSVLERNPRKEGRLAQTIGAAPVTPVHRGTIVGCILGVGVGALVGLAVAVMPGTVSSTGVTGIVVIALIGAVLGALAGTGMGAFSALGVPARKGVRYGGRFVAGAIFVVVDAGDRRDEAERLMEQAGATGVG